MKFKRIAVLILAAVALPVFSTGVALAHDASITLTEQNGSGQNGTAVFADQGDGTTKVTIEISNGTAEPQPAHIHKGTCANLDPKPAYPLNSVVNGKSETIVPVDVHDLTDGAFAVNIHKSAAEVTVYTSCGNIVAEHVAEGVSAGMPKTGSGDTITGMVLLGAAAGAMALFGLALRRRAEDRM